MPDLSHKALLALSLACYLLSIVEVGGQSLEAKSVFTNLQTSGLPLFTFHGSVRAGKDAKVPILLHVLVKVKRRTNGSVVVRTTSYPERVNVQGDFSPTPQPMDIFLEHNSSHSWQPLQLSMHGLLTGSGPVVHELTIPRALSSEDFRLRVLDWPIYYTVNLIDLANQNRYGPTLKSSGAFQNAVVIGDLHGVNVMVGAQILATHMTHHFALGFDLYLVYVRGTALSKALQENPVTASYIHAGSLQTISLDALQVPLYDNQTRTVYDAYKIIAYNHAALMLWGDRFHLAVIDIDEMWSSKDATVTVNHWFDKCFPSADIISATRVEMVCGSCANQGVSELDYFQQHWSAADSTQVLQSFSKVISFHPDPKSVFDVDKVGQVWLHFPFAADGSQASNVVVSDKAFDLAEDCVFVVHLPNLFSDRVATAGLPENKHHWAVHRHRTTSRLHSIDDPISI